MVHVHQLDSCAPTPLAHYLKALGILRLVAEQADADVRGWWEGDRFQLASTLSRNEVEDFFLHCYQPTPLVSPWNKGSGFFYTKVQPPWLSSLEDSKSDRFKPFRDGIKAARASLNELLKADKAVRNIKAETTAPDMARAEKDRVRDSDEYKKRLREAEKNFKNLKSDLIPNLRLNWRGTQRKWMDATMVLDNKGVAKYPALLGTGGNDGRFDFTNNFMRRLEEIFDLKTNDGGPQPVATYWVSGLLWGTPVPEYSSGKSVGQYLPGTAGGANNSNGPNGDSMVNPLDFVLMLEGTLAFSSHATCRFGSLDASRAASPFTVSACGAAYASASINDESARGEQWMPLWSQPSTFTEIQHLLGEGRAQLGTKTVHDPLDLARAISRLGTTRGISAFQRYSYIERNGQSNLAVPLGRFNVARQPSEQVACLDDLDFWLRRLRRAAREQNAPTRLYEVEKRLMEALFTTTEHPEQPEVWQRVLLRLTEVEEIMKHGSGFAAQPIPRLRPEWVTVANDGSAEFRLGLAFALQASDFLRKEERTTDTIRRHWLPLDSEQQWRFATTDTGAAMRLDIQPDVVMHGRHGIDDAVALIERRLTEASQRDNRYLPLKAAPHASASVADLVELLSGGIDMDRVLELARALMALDRKQWAKQSISIESPRTLDWPDDAWLAIRLCMLSGPLKTRSGSKIDIGADPTIVRRLGAGDGAAAIELSLRRLCSKGIRPVVRTGTVPPYIARLWAAALAFPITPQTTTQFLYRLDPNKEYNHEH